MKTAYSSVPDHQLHGYIGSWMARTGEVGGLAFPHQNNFKLVLVKKNINNFFKLPHLKEGLNYF